MEKTEIGGKQRKDDSKKGERAQDKIKRDSDNRPPPQNNLKVKEL